MKCRLCEKETCKGWGDDSLCLLCLYNKDVEEKDAEKTKENTEDKIKVISFEKRFQNRRVFTIERGEDESGRIFTRKVDDVVAWDGPIALKPHGTCEGERNGSGLRRFKVKSEWREVNS